VYHAVELLRLTPVYLEPPIVAGTGIAGSISPAAVRQAVDAHPDIRLVALTSPTYEGILTDVSAIAAILHQRGIPLLVDEAHGAHLGLSPHFPAGAVKSGADIVVQSLHKTLPSLTQTAILHLQGDLIPQEHLQHALGIFQSSSPSYPLLASIEGCVAALEAKGADLLSAWRGRLDDFYGAIDLEHLSLLTQAQDPAHIYALDPGKLTILCNGTNQTGTALMHALRTDFRIEAEMALDGHLLAMTGLNTTEEDLARLGDALQQIDRRIEPAPHCLPLPLPPMPAQRIPAGEAIRAPGKAIPFVESVGQIAGTYLWVYPPGIPLVTPGSEITQEVADCLQALTERGVILKSTIPTAPGLIQVVDKG